MAYFLRAICEKMDDKLVHIGVRRHWAKTPLSLVQSPLFMHATHTPAELLRIVVVSMPGESMRCNKCDMSDRRGATHVTYLIGRVAVPANDAPFFAIEQPSRTLLAVAPTAPAHEPPNKSKPLQSDPSDPP
jgi:hypothetical protein